MWGLCCMHIPTLNQTCKQCKFVWRIVYKQTTTSPMLLVMYTGLLGVEGAADEEAAAASSAWSSDSFP
eukprot:3162493-Amphidinium_carterae.2